MEAYDNIGSEIFTIQIETNADVLGKMTVNFVIMARLKCLILILFVHRIYHVT